MSWWRWLKGEPYVKTSYWDSGDKSMRYHAHVCRWGMRHGWDGYGFGPTPERAVEDALRSYRKEQNGKYAKKRYKPNRFYLSSPAQDEVKPPESDELKEIDRPMTEIIDEHRTGNSK